MVKKWLSAQLKKLITSDGEPVAPAEQEETTALTKMITSDGEPVAPEELKEPQTAEMRSLHHEFQGHPSRGLTPSKLASIMDRAEQGDITAQFELYEDMEEKDGHVMAEMGKRRRALNGLQYTLVPPKNPSKEEKYNTDAMNDVIQGLDNFEDVLFDVTDGIGKGFCCLEYGGWDRVNGAMLPKSIQHRPQGWFQIVRGFEQKIHLRGPGNGEPLQPFGWMVHTHKAKSGYLERSALFRVLLWPYLFKNYSVGDLAEFLEIYGIPLRLGKYPSGATNAEKNTLMRALAQIGHNAAGIIPQGMELEFHKAAEGDPAAFKLMIEWCEKTQSKAILGGTLTSQADGASSTNALGNVHNEVRKELVVSDANQIEKTLSRDLFYPIALLNGLTTDWTRCPRFKFDTTEPEDMAVFAASAPVLVGLGVKMKRQWAQERLGIPEPEEGEEILTLAPAPPSQAPQQEVQEALTALTAQVAALNAQPKPKTIDEQLDDRLQPITGKWLAQIRELVNTADSLEQIRDGLEMLLPGMKLEDYAAMMGEALRVAELAGRDDIMSEATNAR